MAISSDTRKLKVAALRVHHQDLFNSLGIPDAKFIPKSVFLHKDDVEVTLFFLSELKTPEDIYTEKVSNEAVSEDPTRQLYKWKYNATWADDYVPRDIKSVYIPFSEFTKVESLKPITKPTSKRIPQLDLELFETGIPGVSKPDENMDKMTKRDYAAIHLGVPDSNTPWLNEMIIKSKQ